MREVEFAGCLRLGFSHWDLGQAAGIPAVLGVADATKLIPDRATVEVDPCSGDVRIVK